MRLILSIIVLTILSCSSDMGQKQTDKQVPSPPPVNPTWTDRHQVSLKLDTSYFTKHNYQVDSVQIIHYKGTSGEIDYDLINDKGQWLDSIYWISKIEFEDIQVIDNMFSSKQLSEYNPELCCYAPSYALVYYKDNSVITYCSISLQDPKIHSTAKFRHGSNYAALDREQFFILQKIISKYTSTTHAGNIGLPLCWLTLRSIDFSFTHQQ